MADFGKSREISSRAGTLSQWLTEYFQTRAHLASSESDFHCDPACARPGCKHPDLQVPVNLIDLAGAALYRGESVSTLFRRHYAFALLANERDDWIRMVSLKVRKPCPFLENDRCSIYPVRPLPCALFPENLVYEGTFEAKAGENHFKDYLCLQGHLPLSPARARVIAKLKKMWERENLLTSFYLYGHGSCHLDFGNLIEELLAAAGPEPRRIIPHQTLERFFLERMANHPPFSAVQEKIAQLDSPEELAGFLQLFENDRLSKRLRQDRDARAPVFRLAKGRLQARRRSLLPRAYHFYG